MRIIDRYDSQDTIVAQASAAGPALRGIVRLSGPEALTVASRVFSIDLPARQLARATRLDGNIDLGATPELGTWTLPAQALVWPNSQSFTRQPAVELHTSAAPVILERLVDRLVQSGARLAEPGEFTLRAFLAGRLDLTQAEGILGVIHAQADSQLQTGLQQLSGGVGRPIQQARDNLLDSLAHLEAGLDFVEEDIEFIQRDALLADLAQALGHLDSLRQQVQHRRTDGSRPKVALIGRPNAGKSSLFNAICRQPHALISDQAGTTRDYLSREVEIEQLRFELIDTAGLDPTSSTITPSTSSDEKPAEPLAKTQPDSLSQGIDQAAQQMTHRICREADLLVHCVEVTELTRDSLPPALQTSEIPAETTPSQILQVATKLDLASPDSTPPAHWLPLSSHSGQGLDHLLDEIRSRLKHSDAKETVLVSTASRAKASLEAACAALAQAIQATEEGWGEEIVAAEIRLALQEMGKITGEIYTDDVLDRIFSRFCIGK